MTNILFKTIKLLPFAMLAVTALEPAGAWPVDAQAEGQRAVVRVSYADLDLSSAAGNETFLRRIKAGVRKVCNPSTTEIAAMTEAGNCRRQALEGALVQQRQIIANAENQRREKFAAR